MGKFKRNLITTALPYANGPVHIGHLAGVYIPADIYVRYLRQKGEDVIFIGGSDEHGVPITIKAQKEGVTPQDIVDRYHELIKKSFREFGISFDIYSRTSMPLHYDTASDFFRKLYDKDDFVAKTGMQYYDVEAGQFLADRYIVGKCPFCGNEKAYGDQCEACGTSLNASDLINPVSAITGNRPELKETLHWYLPLERYEAWLRKWILEEHKEWKSNVYGQCKSWLDNGLQPRAVTRDLNWGVPVPVEGAEGKVLYVWFDAPIGYISATKELTSEWEKYWKDPETRMIHFIGKDNIVFHCIIFPAMLKAEGDYILPDNVPANEFLNLEGDKISTSRNWAVWLNEYLEDFKDKQDVLRYVLTANAPETKDSDFTWKDFQTRNNSELVAVYGNFINRTLVLTHKYYGGVVPETGELTDEDRSVLEEISGIVERVEDNLEHFHFREALKECMGLARLGNKYLADMEPWKLIKTEPRRVETVINICIQIAGNLSVLTEPFLPFSAAELRDFLNIEPVAWKDMGAEVIAPGHKINPAGLLFEKIEDTEIQRQLDKLARTKETNRAAEAKIQPVKPDSVEYRDFLRLDIRTGKVLEAEKVAKTRKLMKLKVDVGTDVRTIVSGIAEFYKPEEVVGRKVAVLINLESRTSKGIESRGMILMAESPDGRLAFVEPDKDFPVGSVIA